MPSQAGRDVRFCRWKRSDHSIAERRRPAAAARRRQPPPPPPTATPPPRRPPRRRRRPPPPRPLRAPKSTPLPEPVATPDPNKFAMLTVHAAAGDSRSRGSEATPPPDVAPTAPPVIPRPRPERAASAYQPEKQQTRMTGRITIAGAPSVNAVGTPLGKYQKAGVRCDRLALVLLHELEDRPDQHRHRAGPGGGGCRTGKVKNLRSSRTVRTRHSPTSACNLFRRRKFPRFRLTWSPALPEGRLPWKFLYDITRTDDRYS